MPPPLNLAATRASELDVDYSIYLVTDSSEAILGKRNLLEVVEEALNGGVSIVQYREKKLEAKAMVEQCIRLRDLCHKYKAKFIVNDRVDVAYASGADGVHLGQDDISIKDARAILGKRVIIGISCSTVDEAMEAIQLGADYLGIGAVYATSTKSNVSGILGISGVREIVSAVGKATEGSKHIPCVAIGGLNASNIQLLKYKTHTSDGYLNGVAVVSAIMAAPSPQAAACYLRASWHNDAPWQVGHMSHDRKLPAKAEDLFPLMGNIAYNVVGNKTMSHNMTNIVVANFTANVLIASGLSPIMSKAKEEVADLAKLEGGLVINIGTSTPDELPIFIAGVQAYNSTAGPVLLDPVGCGATDMRLGLVTEIMNRGHVDFIKGNESEIQALWTKTGSGQRGVDSKASLSSDDHRKQLVASLARRERCIVLMTGEQDYLSDGHTTIIIRNGDYLLGEITGSGCALGALIVGFAAAHKEDKLLAALTAVLFYEIAAELADARQPEMGPGSFVPRLLDALSRLQSEAVDGECEWLSRARIEILD